MAAAGGGGATMEGDDKQKRKAIFADIRKYYCLFCGISRSKKSLITSHLHSQHPEEMKNTEEETEGQKGRNTNTCEECGAGFKKPAHLKQHMLSHSFQIPKLFESV